MAIEDTDAAVVQLVRALRAEREPRQRYVSASAVRGLAVLTADLHDIATATHRHLHHINQAEHPLYRWTVVYQPDGAHFIATAPS